MTKIMLGTTETEVTPLGPSKRHHHIKLISELSVQEYEEFTRAIETLYEFLKDSQLFMIAQWNYVEFVELINSYHAAYEEKKRELFLQRHIHININRAFLNFFSSIRSYLDFMERLLKNRFGNESEILRKFKLYCITEYDGNFSYRFFYNLRHYAQHKGLPISLIRFGQSRSKEPNKIDHFLEVRIVRVQILDDFDWRALKT